MMRILPKRKPHTQPKPQGTRGFSLVELIIVVAILGALVAVFVPSYFSHVEKSRAAACMANRDSLRSLLTIAFTEDGTTGVTAEYNGQGKQFICPSGGTLSFTLDEATGSVAVYCSEHDPQAAGNMGSIKNNGGSNQTLSFFGALEALSSSRAYFDRASAEQLAALKTAGFDLDQLGATYWYYDGSGYTPSRPSSNSNLGKFYWSDTDYTKLNVGDTFYTMKLSSAGNYTVWQMKVTAKSNGTTTIGEVSNAMLSPKDPTLQTYENALALYNEAVHAAPGA